MTRRLPRNQNEIVYPLDDDPMPEARLPSMHFRPRLNERSVLRWWLFWIAVVIATAIGSFAAWPADMDYPNCSGWISQSCCCTNNCCFEVQPGTVRQLDNDTFLVVASGQIVKRTGWSKDGRFMRCACDQIGGKWTVTPTANTRCIYPPRPMM